MSFFAGHSGAGFRDRENPRGVPIRAWIDPVLQEFFFIAPSRYLRACIESSFKSRLSHTHKAAVRPPFETQRGCASTGEPIPAGVNKPHAATHKCRAVFGMRLCHIFAS